MLDKLTECDERQFKALTGLSRGAFHKLLMMFTVCYEEIIQENYEKNKAQRQRKPGAGQKGRLNTSEKKLFFLLYYLKTYPTFDVLGYHFDLDRSKACTNVHSLFPVLLRTLDRLKVLPQRQFNRVEELQATFADIAELFIDATERPHCRPQEAQAQKEKFSGKSKRHTVKNTVIVNACKMILFLGYTIFGSKHDYSLFKTEFPPDQTWFKIFKLWVDLGYLGIKTDYEAVEINIPHKKPRKSKANPAPTLTDEQKEENRLISSIRVIVEHAIGGMKRFNALVAKFRNRKPDFVDDVAVSAAGLHNLMVALAMA
jgi:DDE superfamily endonuclease/Helix-turn-helix of DDE superfamily endonuclease